MSGANDEDLGTGDEDLGRPAAPRNDLPINGGGHGGLLGAAQLLEQGGEGPGGGFPGLIVDDYAHTCGPEPDPLGAGWQAEVWGCGNARPAFAYGMRSLRLLASCLLGLALAHAAETPSTNMKESSDPKAAPRAIIHTTYGDMTVEFWPDVAPRTVENFLKLAREGFYDGTCFHRILKGFMIQGGCPNSKLGAKGQPGTGGPGYQIKAEFNNRSHTKGVLSMARTRDPDSAGSQFFICHGVASSLNNEYTAFGKLVDGEKVLDKIAAIACVGPERSSPTERVEVTSVEVVGEKKPEKKSEEKKK